MVVTFCGLTLLLLGRAMFRALAFPIGYLIAMIPVWDLLTARVHPYFQDYSASLGVATLRALDLPVHRDGFFLYLPNVTLEVARECSGVNNLIAVLCVGIPMTHLSVGQWWKRGLILAAAVLIALLSNGARVAMVSLFAYYGIRGADGDIHGPFSLLRSLMVSGVGFLVLFWLISRFGDTEAPPGRTTRQTHREERFSLPVLNPIPLVVAAIMLASANALGAWREVAPVPIAAELDGFPQQLGSWRATGVAATSGMEALNFDRSLSRVYSSPDGDEAHVFIGYYGHQTQGRELADYRMRNALVGPVTVAQTLRIGDDFRVKDFVTVKGGQAQHVTYWYVLDGRIVPEDYQVKLYTAWNSLSRGRSNGAVVVVRARADEPIAGARGRVRQLVADAVSASRADGPASGAGRRVSN
jgi:EpsI family protein